MHLKAKEARIAGSHQEPGDRRGTHFPSELQEGISLADTLILDFIAFRMMKEYMLVVLRHLVCPWDTNSVGDIFPVIWKKNTGFRDVKKHTQDYIVSRRLVWASLVAQSVKNPPAMQETWVQSLGWDDPLEEGMATHSSILAWRIPWTEGSVGLQSMRSQRVWHDCVTKHSIAQEVRMET